MDLFNIYTLIALALGLIVGTFVGVGLGRRSTTANEYYDKARKEADELRNKLALAEAKLRDKTGQ